MRPNGNVARWRHINLNAKHLERSPASIRRAIVATSSSRLLGASVGWLVDELAELGWPARAESRAPPRPIRTVNWLARAGQVRALDRSAPTSAGVTLCCGSEGAPRPGSAQRRCHRRRAIVGGGLARPPVEQIALAEVRHEQTRFASMRRGQSRSGVSRPRSAPMFQFNEIAAIYRGF